MYWTVYETLVLVTGLLTAAIALVPIPTIPPKTRMLSVVIGGGLVLASIVLGNIPSFTYPGIVFIAPLIPVIAAGVIAKTALDKKKMTDAASRGEEHGPMQYDHSAGAVGPRAFVQTDRPAEPERAAASGAVEAPAHGTAEASDPVVDTRAATWAELFDPQTSASRLAAIAADHPEFATQIASHPNAYPALIEWARSTEESIA